jgi:hypothetical protein
MRRRFLDRQCPELRAADADVFVRGQIPHARRIVLSVDDGQLVVEALRQMLLLLALRLECLLQIGQPFPILDDWNDARAVELGPRLRRLLHGRDRCLDEFAEPRGIARIVLVGVGEKERPVETGRILDRQLQLTLDGDGGGRHRRRERARKLLGEGRRR